MPNADVPAASHSTGRRGSAWSLVRWIVSSLVVALVAVVACLPWLVGTPERVTKLVAAAIPELAADVKPARVRIGWFGPIVLEDLAIVPRNGDRTPIEVRRVEVEHGLAGILLSAGDLGRVRIEGLQADIVFDKEHRTNLDSILPPREPGQAPRGKGPRRAAIALRLDVDNAVVRISGPWTSDPWVSDPIDARATLANAADGFAAWTIEPVKLLKQAQLQQTVAHEVLAYIVPVFADAARTSGRFSLRLDGATFPVGRPEEATLAGLLEMHEVVLGPGPLVENMFRSLPFNLPPPPTIRITDEADVAFHLADRRMWHEGLEFGIPLKKSGQRLDVRSQGSVGLDDRSLDLKLALPIPADLPQDRPLVAALAGKQVSLGVGGVLGEPKVIFDGSIKDAAGQVVVDLIDRLRNGPRPQPLAPPAGAMSDQPRPADAQRLADGQGPAAGSGPPQPGWTPPGATPSPRSGSAAKDAATTDAAADTATTPPAADAEASPATETPRDKAEKIAADAAAKAGVNPDTADAIADVVGGVLDEVARRRAERRATEAANPEQVPPRRGRLFQRRAPPTLQPSPGAPPAAPAPAAPPAAAASPSS
jgi:hypothetical protein